MAGKTYWLAGFLLWLSLGMVAAQTSPWSQFATSPSGTSRHDDIYFIDATTGWATRSGLIYKMSDGTNWVQKLSKTGTHFRCIAFATATRGFAGNLGVGSYDSAVTDNNVLYRTYDGGNTWANVPGFAEAGMKGLCSMYVLDANHIYGGGRVRGPAYFIKSNDGGTNWTMVNLTAMGVMNGIMDIYFRDQTNGFVVGMDTNAYSTSCSPPYYGRIAKTTDGGATWTTVVTTTIPCAYFWKMSWPTTNIGYCSLQQNGSYNNIVFYKTVDGGNHWVSNGIPLAGLGLAASSWYLQGIGFVNANEGWMGGSASLPNYGISFLHTTDGGATWSGAGYNDTYRMNRIRFLSATLGFASGEKLHIFHLPLVITNQPQDVTVSGGTNVSLNVGVAGDAPFVYQWRKNGAIRPGATNATLTLTNVVRVDSGTYSVTVTNAAASLQSSNALLRVMVPERLAAPLLLPGPEVRLLFSDADGGPLTTNDVGHFEVLASTNLVDWFVIPNSLTLTNGSMLFEDSVTNSDARFYRVREH